MKEDEENEEGESRSKSGTIPGHGTGQPRSVDQSFQSPPTFPPRVLVCNVNAAWDVISGGCGIGGVFSGCMEMPLPNLSEAHSYVSSVLMAEVIDVRLAVSSARELGVLELIPPGTRLLEIVCCRSFELANSHEIGTVEVVQSPTFEILEVADFPVFFRRFVPAIIDTGGGFKEMKLRGLGFERNKRRESRHLMIFFLSSPDT
ncbi:hypothetical protein DY000_02044449 [Brassica cretica]|uniref:Uncharacterized protein n=1 Tax=Brassica cretica TaxID=69181 RepID=A0ABQ7F4R7_BRACR|nr:hypothetical protein DY000_02044449 [Brassica cretica]